MKKNIKLVLLNFFILLGILIGINLILVSYWELRRSQFVEELFRNIRGNVSEAAYLSSLPNYKNDSLAQVHFEEFQKLRREYRSYIAWRSLPCSGQTIVIDSLGCRYTPQHPNCKSEAPRVVFIGGSTTWGYGSDNGNTIPALFAQNANGAYAVDNFGESGYRAFQGYLYLLDRINWGYKPAIVVSYDGVNDVNGLRKELRATSHSRAYQIRKSLEGADGLRKFEDLNLKDYLLDPILATISLIGPKKENNKESLFNYSPSRVDSTAKTLLNSWKASKQLAEKNGAYFLAVLQPCASVGKPRLDHISIDTVYQAQQKYYYPRVLELIESDSNYTELKSHFLDLSNCLNSDEYYFIDPGHISPNGNKVIAKKIWDKISELKFTKENSIKLKNEKN